VSRAGVRVGVGVANNPLCTPELVHELVVREPARPLPHVVMELLLRRIADPDPPGRSRHDRLRGTAG
jgi:hypothetical protein